MKILHLLFIICLLTSLPAMAGNNCNMKQKVEFQNKIPTLEKKLKHMEKKARSASSAEKKKLQPHIVKIKEVLAKYKERVAVCK